MAWWRSRRRRRRSVSESNSQSARIAALLEKHQGSFDSVDLQTLMIAHQTAKRLEQGEGFNCQPVVSNKTGEAKVDATWMAMLAQLTTDQARSIALGLIECAADAESDAVMMAFLAETNLDPEQQVQTLAILRSKRAKRREIVAEKQEPAGLAELHPLGSKPM